ncbi:hypothetical protein ABTX81_13050 [Kitasatospora sp. NPDC097605]|uniref:hypothetical protein n=1 Tax=Kitasatospora sp. NPDC097605 TaxID=3157226 RepID=UPI00331E6092
MNADPVRDPAEASEASEAGRRRTGPGSVRHSLIEPAVTAVLAEVVFGLVGGPPAVAAGAVLLALAALFAGRYVAGAGILDVGLRSRPRLLDAHEPGLSDWRWTVRQGLVPDGDAQPLRGRLQRLFAARLSEVHHLPLTSDLPADRERAARLLGPELWPWIDPAGDPPAPAFPPDVLAALVDRLESL